MARAGRKIEPHGSKLVGSKVESVVVALLRRRVSINKIVGILRSKHKYNVSGPTIKGYKDNYFNKRSVAFKNSDKKRKKDVAGYIDVTKDLYMFLTEFIEKENKRLSELEDEQNTYFMPATESAMNALRKQLLEAKIKLEEHVKEMRNVTVVNDMLFDIGTFFKKNILELIEESKQKEAIEILQIKLGQLEQTYLKAIYK